ncbi:MAG: hypothetical protein ACREKB_02285, partial [Candidatus Rokuibacteriota bacterium]
MSALLAVLVLLIASTVPAAAQARKEDPLQAEQRRLQETQRQLKQEREAAAEARRRETSILAELE